MSNNIDTKAMRAFADRCTSAGEVIVGNLRWLSPEEATTMLGLRDFYNATRDMLRQCADEVDRLRGTLADLDDLQEVFLKGKEDAERYRWLRDDVTDAPGQHHADIIYLKHLHGADLDAAIDRARKGTT